MGTPRIDISFLVFVAKGRGLHKYTLFIAYYEHWTVEQRQSHTPFSYWTRIKSVLLVTETATGGVLGVL